MSEEVKFIPNQQLLRALKELNDLYTHCMEALMRMSEIKIPVELMKDKEQVTE